MAALDKVTAADVAALRDFARHVNRGIRWKGYLRDAWVNGVYPYGLEPNTRAAMQSLRNRLGTSWLTKFNFK